MELYFKFLDLDGKVLFELIVPKWRDITSRVIEQLSEEIGTNKVQLVFSGYGSEDSRFA